MFNYSKPLPPVAPPETHVLLDSYHLKITKIIQHLQKKNDFYVCVQLDMLVTLRNTSRPQEADMISQRVHTSDIFLTNKHRDSIWLLSQKANSLKVVINCQRMLDLRLQLKFFFFKVKQVKS